MQYLCVEVSQIQGDFSFSLQHSTPIYVDIVRSLPRIPDPRREHQTSSPQRGSAAGPVLNAAAIMYFFIHKPIGQMHCVCVSSRLSSKLHRYCTGSFVEMYFRSSHRNHETSYKRYIWVCDISLSTKQITFLST